MDIKLTDGYCTHKRRTYAISHRRLNFRRLIAFFLLPKSSRHWQPSESRLVQPAISRLDQPAISRLVQPAFNRLVQPAVSQKVAVIGSRLKAGFQTFISDIFQPSKNAFWPPDFLIKIRLRQTSQLKNSSQIDASGSIQCALDRREPAEQAG